MWAVVESPYSVGADAESAIYVSSVLTFRCFTSLILIFEIHL